MNDSQENFITTIYTVQGVLEENAPKYAGNVGLTNLKDELNSLIAQIEAVIPEQHTRSTGFATLKNQLRAVMVEKVHAVAGGIRAYAESAGKAELLPVVDFTLTDWNRMRELTCAVRSGAVHELAQKEAAALADWGVTEQMIAELGTAIAAYDDVLPKPKEKRARRVAMTRKLKELLKKVRALFYERLDDAIEVYRFSAPDFYNEYRAARGIDDLGRGGARGEEPDEGDGAGTS